MMRAALALSLALSSAVSAQEFLATDTALADNDFYRLVACAAPPKGNCKKTRAEASLSQAIDEINAAGTAIQLTRDDSNPDFPILFLDIPARSTIQGSGFQVLEGKSISGAGARVLAKNGMILKSVIIFTTGLEKRAFERLMLEEITQGLGLMTDIGGPYYESRSIFSQSSNALTKLGKQDIIALGRHYPAR
ncbi:conserved hypothetical protein [Rhodobacteraceae bacterium HTCC2083]|nr:conserved hypothetical protein [Rhodobacteraceae bacterium HTCC2083]